MVLGINYKKIKPQQLVWTGFIFAMMLFILCIVSRPESLGHNDGLSYFGAVWWTIIPYSIAFIIYGACCLLASFKLRRVGQSITVMRWMLRLMPVLLVGLVITPHTLINPLHKTFGSALFALQLMASMYLFYKNKKEFYIFFLIIITFASGLMSAAFLFLPSGFMIQAQIVYQLAFVILITHYLKIYKKLN